MSPKKPLFRIQFIANGERYELYVRELCQGSLFGFIESHEKLKAEFADVTRTYVPMHSVLRIDEVNKQGTAKISELADKVTAFPSPIYTPKH
jgi:hypothetical protein